MRAGPVSILEMAQAVRYEMLVESKVMRCGKGGQMLARLFRRSALDPVPHSDERIIGEVMKEGLSPIEVFQGPQSYPRRLCGDGRR